MAHLALHTVWRCLKPTFLGWAAVVMTIVTEGACYAATQAFISPEVINSHAIFSSSCSKIIYSSNRSGFVRPFVIDMRDPASPRVSALTLAGERDFIAQSLAPDCRTLAMVSDQGGNGQFEIFLYDLQNSKLRKISDAPGEDQGKPVFAPRGQILAYLDDGRLSLYDYVRSSQLAVPPVLHSFQSVTWSEDGTSVFLEDERFDIWQYNVRSSLFHNVWSGEKPGYVSRMISEHDGQLLFTTDEKSPFRQIYRLDLKSGSPKPLYAAQHDEFSPIELDDGHFTLRTNVDGDFAAVELAGGKAQTRSPAVGVVYDFSLAFGAPLLLYSNDHLPTDFYWFERGTPRPLVPKTSDVQQPAAITIKDSSGVPNFLYLPSPKPRAVLIWLHGGPHEQVSARFNLYFDFLARRNIAVYAINYPGSTGFGKDYAMFGQSQDQALPIQVRHVEEDIHQLHQARPELYPQMLVGVSYGSVLAHRLAAAHPEFQYMVDFSGIANDRTLPNGDQTGRTYPKTLFIYGADDPASKIPGRAELIAWYKSHTKVSVLVLPQEGHFIAHRDSIDRILQSLDAFLNTPVDRQSSSPPAQ